MKGSYSTPFILVLIIVLSLSFASAAELPRQQTFRFSLSANSQWDSTTKEVRPTEIIQFNVFGTIKTSRTGGIVGPQGAGEADSAFPCPEATAYSVVAKVGETGKCFEVGLTKTFTPDLPGYLYLAVNDDAPSDNSGKFDVETIIIRPVCGDEQCDSSEIGFCSLDCSWCGDSRCGQEETCTSCAKDCGICPADIDSAKKSTINYYGALNKMNYDLLAEITGGKLSDYYDSMRRFVKEVDVILTGFDKEDAPKYEFSEKDYENVSVLVDEINDSSARLIASYNEGDEVILLSKGAELWKVYDVLDNGESFVDSINFEYLREKQNNYMDLISNYTAENAVSEGDSEGNNVMWIIIIVVVILLVLGFAGYFLVKKGYFKIPKFRQKFVHKPHDELIDRKDDAEAGKDSVIKDGKVNKEDKKSVNRQVPTKECTKCGTKLFEHEKFCIKCGKRV